MARDFENTEKAPLEALNDPDVGAPIVPGWDPAIAEQGSHPDTLTNATATATMAEHPMNPRRFR